MLNDKGEIAECTGDNVFVLSKEFFTPSIGCWLITRDYPAAVMDIAIDLGIPCREQALTRYDLWTAEECFLTGTAAEVIPCVEVDHRQVGNGEPGSTTKSFISKFRENVRKDGVRL